ncbi:hypothetical protein P9112_003502 [Eukaryota sp. TZLM1-RC]
MRMSNRNNLQFMLNNTLWTVVFLRSNVLTLLRIRSVSSSFKSCLHTSIRYSPHLYIPNSLDLLRFILAPQFTSLWRSSLVKFILLDLEDQHLPTDIVNLLNTVIPSCTLYFKHFTIPPSSSLFSHSFKVNLTISSSLQLSKISDLLTVHNRYIVFNVVDISPQDFFHKTLLPSNRFVEFNFSNYDGPINLALFPQFFGLLLNNYNDIELFSPSNTVHLSLLSGIDHSSLHKLSNNRPSSLKSLAFSCLDFDDSLLDLSALKITALRIYDYDQYTSLVLPSTLEMLSLQFVTSVLDDEFFPSCLPRMLRVLRLEGSDLRDCVGFSLPYLKELYLYNCAVLPSFVSRSISNHIRYIDLRFSTCTHNVSHTMFCESCVLRLENGLDLHGLWRQPFLHEGWLVFMKGMDGLMDLNWMFQKLICLK